MKNILFNLLLSAALVHAAGPPRQTTVSIVGEDFHIDGQPTYRGREWRGQRVEGLLMNSRMVQAVFDDANPETAARWAYPDTGKWDAERNTREFIAAMPEWKKHGLLAFTVNFQGGSPAGYAKSQPWDTGAFEAACDTTVTDAMKAANPANQFLTAAPCGPNGEPLPAGSSVPSTAASPR